MRDSKDPKSGPLQPGVQVTRRHLLRTTAAAIAAGAILTSGAELFAAAPAPARGADSPEGALSRLMEGNHRFVSGHMLTSSRDLRKLRQANATSQHPFAAVLACSDSRVPVETLFDQSIGDLFIARVAGNMMTPEIIGSLEYGAAVLGTKAILVLGHSECGAVKAAIANKPVPGQIGTLFPHLRPAVDQAGTNVRAVTEANARIQARLLAQSSPLLAEKVKERQLEVAAGYYDIVSGVVTLLG